MSSIAKMIELSADSDKSFEDALATGINKATSTLRGVRGIWIKDQEVLLRDGATSYRLHLKVTFQLEK